MYQAKDHGTDDHRQAELLPEHADPASTKRAENVLQKPPQKQLLGKAGVNKDEEEGLERGRGLQQGMGLGFTPCGKGYDGQKDVHDHRCQEAEKYRFPYGFEAGPGDPEGHDLF